MHRVVEHFTNGEKETNEHKIILNRSLSCHDSENLQVENVHALEKWKLKKEICKQLLCEKIATNKDVPSIETDCNKVVQTDC